MTDNLELIGALVAIVTPLVAIVYRLGAIHADFRALIGTTKDHETRLRRMEHGCKNFHPVGE